MKRLLLLSSLCILAACGGDSATSPATSIVGTYALFSVDGKTVPAVIEQDASGRIEALSGSIVLRADGTYSETASFRFTVGGQANTDTQTLDGSYVWKDTTVTLTESVSRDTVSGTFDGRAVTFNDGETILVFKRE